MASTKTKAKAGVKSTKVLATHPALRRAAVRAATPTAKLGWRAKAPKNAKETTNKRVLPALAVGVAIVAVALYLLAPERRRRLQERFTSHDDQPNTPSPSDTQIPSPSAAGVQP
jgi:hypothetical protein